MTRGSGTLVAVCTATFMLLLNVAMPSVSLPAIATDLGGTLTDSQWVITAYALTLATFLLTAGSLADWGAGGSSWPASRSSRPPRCSVPWPRLPSS